jgi:hypothetical protein
VPNTTPRPLKIGLFDRQSVAVVGIARQRLGMGDELAALGAMQRRGDGGEAD